MLKLFIRVNQHPLLKATLVAFSAACRATSISSPYSPLTSLRRNLMFPPGCSSSFLLDHWPSSNPEAGDFFQNRLIRDRIAIECPESSKPIPQGSYLQIHHFLMQPTHKPLGSLHLLNLYAWRKLPSAI